MDSPDSKTDEKAVPPQTASTANTPAAAESSLLTTYRGWLVVIALIVVFAGATAIAVAHTNQFRQHNAMMQADAMKKADAATAAKAAEDMKLPAANPTTGDNMMHGSSSAGH